MSADHSLTLMVDVLISVSILKEGTTVHALQKNSEVFLGIRMLAVVLLTKVRISSV